MSTSIQIDFVSDIVCPWCAVGLKSLEAAIARVGDEIAVDLRFQPFELVPDMAPEGQDIVEHLTSKYGSTAEQVAQRSEEIRKRGAELGFEFRMDLRTRTYNTFDAHRLLHWAETAGHQQALKNALLSAYFTKGENPADHKVLTRLAAEAGLDPLQAQEVLSSNAYATEVREAERFYQSQGIHSVPAVILNGRYLIEGGQPVEVFEQALRQVAAEAGAYSDEPAAG